MGDIYKKAQQDQTKGFYQEILDRLEGLPADTPNWREVLKDTIDDIIQQAEQPLPEKEAWDFSLQKSQSVFVESEGLLIRPIRPEDEEFYRGVRVQYSLLYESAYKSAKEKNQSLFITEVSPPEVFYCIIEENDTPIGYVGIKDTSVAIWEIAIELDAKYTKRGLGPQSIRLYLNEVQRITGKGEFRAVVEVDNVSSQKCLEGLGAELVGLCDSVVLKTEEEKSRFEERNLGLIDAHMEGLATRLGVEPRKLLSHLLEYRLACPLSAAVR